MHLRVWLESVHLPLGEGDSARLVRKAQRHFNLAKGTLSQPEESRDLSRTRLCSPDQREGGSQPMYQPGDLLDFSRRGRSL